MLSPECALRSFLRLHSPQSIKTQDPEIEIEIEMATKGSKVCDETLVQLKCQVCKSGPRPDKVSRYNCLYGHVICQDCESKMDPELWTLLLNSMQVKCINKSKGCNEVLNKEAMILHEPECIQNYRLVACPRDHESMLKMPFHKLLHHLKKEHSLGYRHFKKLSFNEKLIQNIPFKDGAYYSTMWLYYSTVMIKIDGNFFIHSMREICTKEPKDTDPDLPEFYGKAQIYQWVHFIGSPKEAKNYTYTLEYYGNDDSTSIFTGQVIPVDEDYDSIVSNYNSFKCFKIDFAQFASQFIKNKQIKYSIMIRNLKDKNANEEVEQEFKFTPMLASTFAFKG